MKKTMCALLIGCVALGGLSIFSLRVEAAREKPATAVYGERVSKVEGDVEKLRNDLYVVAVEAANRSGQATSRLIAFVGVIATVFGVIVALAGGFIAYEGVRARRKSKEAVETLEEAKLFVENEVERLKKKFEEVSTLIQFNLEQLTQDTEEAGRKVTETSTRKIEELEAKDITLEREQDRFVGEKNQVL
jgi:polyhydroxyalkanoate synthesis regulator phasin